MEEAALTAELQKFKNKKVEIHNEQESKNIVKELKDPSTKLF